MKILVRTIETVILQHGVLNIDNYILSGFERLNPWITLKNKSTLKVKVKICYLHFIYLP